MSGPDLVDEKDWWILGSETYRVFYRVSHDRGAHRANMTTDTQ